LRRSQRRGSRGRRRPRNWSLSPLKISACSIRSSPDSAQRAITLISSSTRSMASIRAGAAQPQMVEGHLIEEDGLTWTSRLYASSPVGWPAPDTGPSRWSLSLPGQLENDCGTTSSNPLSSQGRVRCELVQKKCRSFTHKMSPARSRPAVKSTGTTYRSERSSLC